MKGKKLKRVFWFAIILLAAGCTAVVEVNVTPSLPTVVSLTPSEQAKTLTPTLAQAEPSSTATLLPPTTTATLTPSTVIATLYNTAVPMPPTWTPSTTPTITATALTPTPETMLDTPTPVLTLAPTLPPPDEAICYAGAIYGLNIRNQPSTNGQVVGYMGAGTRFEVVALNVVNSNQEWGQLTNGNWVALKYNTELARLEDKPACWELPGAYTMRAGMHVLMGDGSTSVLNFPDDMQVMKCLDGSFDVCDEWKRQNPSGVTICRSLHTTWGMKDCPDPWMYDSPSIWQDGLIFHPGCDYYEIMNECGPPPGGYSQLATWSIAMAQYVEEETGSPMLAFSFPPGNPTIEAWGDLLPYLRWVAENPLPDGRYHGVATHSSSYVTFNPPPDATWLNDLWLAQREVVACDYLANFGFDCVSWPGVWAHTEIGLHDGYAGTWRNDWTCEQVADAYKTTIATMQNTGIVDMILWWNVGKISKWSSVHDCLSLMLS